MLNWSWFQANRQLFQGSINATRSQHNKSFESESDNETIEKKVELRLSIQEKPEPLTRKIIPNHEQLKS
jgi:hypothetical protein